MSFLKFSPNLFLEEIELERLKSFLDDNGFRRFLLTNSKQFGLIKNEQGDLFSNALITNGVSGTISQNSISFIDSSGNLGTKAQELNIPVPDDGLWYWIKVFYEELKLTENFFHEVSGGKDHLWFRPWLKESIYFRSSMIHPLNVIQKIALEKSYQPLLRTTVAGISSGMLTTG
jgi:hypothetical protein